MTLPTASYKLGKQTLTMLGDGWPINFDGGVEDLPPEEIQLTRCVMFAGALQAASLKPHRLKNKGIIPLDAEEDATLLERYTKLMEELSDEPERPIGNPDDWADVVREIAENVQSEVAVAPPRPTPGRAPQTAK